MHPDMKTIDLKVMIKNKRFTKFSCYI